MAARPSVAAARIRRLAAGLPDARGAALLIAVLVALTAVGWGAGELSQSLHGADLQAVRDVAAERSASETALARVVSRLGSSLLIAPLALACCLVLYRARGAAAAARLAIGTAGAVVIFNLDKLLVARPRPPVAHLEPATHFSFPSGHATLAAAFYVTLLILSLSLTRWGVRAAAGLIGVGALLLAIAGSRVYLGVHYPTDVAAGLLLGAAWAVAVAVAFRGGPRRSTPVSGRP